MPKVTEPVTWVVPMLLPGARMPRFTRSPTSVPVPFRVPSLVSVPAMVPLLVSVPRLSMSLTMSPPLVMVPRECSVAFTDWTVPELVRVASRATS